MISIIIPIYNDEKYIKDCLESIIAQTYSDFECLCLDDGSTDNTISIIEEYTKKDSRIRLLKNNHKGPGWERNYGISIAKGEFITFMDHDDFVEPIWLEKLYNTLIKNNVDVAYCTNSDYFEDKKEYKYYYFPDSYGEKLEFNVKTAPDGLICEWFAPWRRLVRRELLIKYNIQFAIGNFKFDDVLFTEELLLNVNSAAFCNEVLYHHRMFRDSITGIGLVKKDIYFEHFETAQEIKKYALAHNKDYRALLIRMFQFYANYLFYVSSKKDYYKKFKKMIYENHFPIKYKLKLFKYFLLLRKDF